MNIVEILLISLGVSVDAFAVSVGGALGCRRNKLSNGINAAFFFGGFQFLMPVAGFYAGAFFQKYVSGWDHWCAFALLTVVGGRMIYEGVIHREAGEDEEPVKCQLDFFSPKKLFIPAVATSIDALMVGASLAFSGVTVWLPAAAMGIVTGVIAFAGVELGYRLKRFGGEGIMTASGGGVIVLIGVKILLSDLLK